MFFDNEAFRPDRAVGFEPRAPIQQRYLERLIAEGAVHEAAPGRYWLDLEAYKEIRRQQFVWSIRILALGALIFILLFVVQAVMRRH